MSANHDDREGFLARWSRRKRGPEAETATAPDSTPDARASAPNAREDDAFADFDFDSLNFTSDYRRFMASAVPDQVRSKALRKLWTSTDIIAQADELDDYLEDFREEAMALPAEMVRSAYRIGRGLVENGQDADADETDEQSSAPEHTRSQVEDTRSRLKTADAPAIVDYSHQTTDCGSGTSVTVPVDLRESPAETDKLSE